MELSGAGLMGLTCVSGADGRSFSRRFVYGGSVSVGDSVRVRVSGRLRMDSGFVDNGHLQYYRASSSPIRCGVGDKQKGSSVLTTKKKLKLLKGLSEGLSMASELGFSLDSEKRTFLDEVQGKSALDAAEVLLKQLEQLRAEEKEMKRQKKAEEKEMKRQKKQEKAKLKESRMKTAPDCESSSSSSSESSDSDCGETIDMSSLRASAALASATLEKPPLPVQELTVPVLSLPSSLSQAGATVVEKFCDVSTTNYHPAEISRNDTNLGSASVILKDENSIATTAPQKRIEVCMGNKCKKSGAPALLEEFEKVMGTEGVVVGCKCMGKCKAGPNVRVQNAVGDDGVAVGLNNDSVKIPANPLCLGVSLEDVDAIVSSFFGENQRDIDMGGATAAATT